MNDSKFVYFLHFAYGEVWRVGTQVVNPTYRARGPTHQGRFIYGLRRHMITERYRPIVNAIALSAHNDAGVGLAVRLSGWCKNSGRRNS